MLRLVDSFERQLKDIKLDIKTCQKEAKSIAQQVKTSKVVTAVSGAVSFLSALCVAGASDFEIEAHTGVDAFTLPEVQAALAVMGIAAGVAVVGGFIHSKLSDKYDDKEFQYIDLGRQLAISKGQVQAIDAEKQRVENQQQFNEEFQQVYGEVSAESRYATENEKYIETFDRIGQKEIAKIDSMVELLKGSETTVVDEFEQ